MTWTSAAPVVGAAVVVLVVPGLLVGLAARLRGVLVLAVAPLLSVAVAGGSAVVAGLVGFPWGVGPLAAGTLGATACAWLLGEVVRRRSRGDRSPEDDAPAGRRGDGPAVWAWSVGGVLVGGAALAAGLTRGLGAPDRWPQTYDAVFHLDAAWRVLHTGDGSSLTLGTLDHPELARAFYPAAWHDLVALVASTTGADVVVATAALATATVAVAWPLSLVALARVAVGGRGPVLGATGVLAAGVTAAPTMLASYGTLWPNALSTAVLPAALALVVAVVRGDVERWPAVVLLVAAVPGLALAHPNAVVALLVLGLAAGSVLLWDRGLRPRLSVVAAALALAWLIGWSPVFASTRSTSWGARQTTGQALGEWLALAPERTPVPLLVASLAVVGAVVAWRRHELRWLLAVHAAGAALYVLVSGSDGRLSRLVSGPWWDDPFRLAALVGVAGVPLAAVGLGALAGRLARVLPGRRSGRRSAGLVVVGLVAVAGLSGGLYRAETTAVVARWAASEGMLGDAERALVERLRTWVPAGERVAGKPWEGAALTGPLADREAVFPHLTGAWGPDRELLATSLADVATRPDVCAALERLDVSYVLVSHSRFWPGDPRRARYAGLDVTGRPGFVEVASSGAASLWRVTAC